MLKNYLLITLRNLQRNTVFAFINIVGLAVGLASSMIILLWVADEMSFNRFHENFDRLYQVHINHDVGGGIYTGDVAPYKLVETLKERSSGIQHVALTNHGEGYLLGNGDIRLNKMAKVVTDDFFLMFSFKALSGNPQQLFSDASTIVLTKSLAKELFGEQDPVQKYVLLENKRELKVVAVIEDVPLQSSIQFEFLLPMTLYEAMNPWMQRAKENWSSNSFRAYVQLQPGAELANVTHDIKDIVKQNSEQSPTAELLLHPISKWRLNSTFVNGRSSGGKIEMVRMFAIVGGFILVIACINFMNLATARSQSRAREVGIRKSVGSRKWQLVLQFISESIVITAIAFALALVLLELVLPGFNTMTDKRIVIDYGNITLWLYAVAIMLVTGLLAGSYPAFYLSSFRPATVLKGKFDSLRGSITPRKVLVTLQFTFSIFLIVGALVMYQQIMHLKGRDIGYNRENLMLVWTTSEIEQSFPTIRNELKRTGLVSAVCKSSSPVTRVFSTNDNVSWPGKQSGKVSFTIVATEYEYTKTMGVKMLEGRDFSEDYPGDTLATVINKSAATLMSLDQTIGSKIRVGDQDLTVIGIMDDVVMDSPYHAVEPMILIFDPGWSSTISVRLEKTEDLTASVSAVEKIFKTFDPAHPLWYRFADEEFEAKFNSVNIIGKLAWILTFLAILISSLGLFGLAAFTAEQRTKELGIRKILGASVSSLLILISRDFTRIIIFAFILAAPLAWVVLNNFLQRYPYRIDFPYWIIFVAGGFALALALAIVSMQTLRAATRNPVESLRSE